MESLIKIEGIVFEKLIDAISSGIGTLYRPRAIRKEADARAYEHKVIEKAKHEAEAEGELMRAETLDIINARIVAKEIARQNNIDDVVEIAADDLRNCESVSEKEVNKDWTTRFFDIVQDISDEEMKVLWGKILAGEVKSPGSYSLRTMELLRNLSKEEAEIFVKVSQFVLRQNEYFVFIGKDGDLSKFGVDYVDIARLTEIGLLQAGTFVHKSYESFSDRENKVGIIYNDRFVLIITIKQNTNELSIPIIALTRAGEELYKLIQVTPNMEYLKELANSVKNENVIVEYSEIDAFEGDGIRFKTPTIKL